VQQVLFTRTRPQDLALFAREVMPAFA